MKPFLNDDEYRYTEFVVDTFRTGAGKVLHQKLKERAQTKKNWVICLTIVAVLVFLRVQPTL